MTSALVRAWFEGFKPPPRLTVSQWAEAHRKLPESSAARGGKWSNETAPYLTAVMDAPLQRGTKQIVVVKAAQVGMSEALTNVILYHVEHRPCPMLLVQPTANAAVTYSKERLSDAIRGIPALRRLISDKRVVGENGLPESTLSLKVFPAGFLAMAGGNSPNSVARWSVRLAIMDDADRLPRFVGLEGDPTVLLTNRVTSFYDGITLFCSTPVEAGGRIEALYEATDERRYHLPCFACGEWNYVAWNDKTHWRVAFDEHDPATARLQCPCGGEVREPERMDLVRQGEWRATGESIAPGFVGFHLPAMLSPFVTLSGLVTKFLAANLSPNPRRLREFVTTQLAEGWKDEATSVAPESIESRMTEEY